VQGRYLVLSVLGYWLWLVRRDEWCAKSGRVQLQVVHAHTALKYIVRPYFTAKKPCPIQLDPVPLNWTHWTVT
jgi:hypothetical protein